MFNGDGQLSRGDSQGLPRQRHSKSRFPIGKGLALSSLPKLRKLRKRPSAPWNLRSQGPGPLFLPFLEDGKCALTLEQYAEVRSSGALGQASQRLARLSLEYSLHQECGPTSWFCSSWVLYGFGGRPLSALGFACEPRQSRQTPQEVLSLCDPLEACVVGLGP